MRHNKKKRLITAVIQTTVLLIFSTCLLSSVLCPLAYADMKLKIAVVNPSQTQEQTMPVRYELPKGINPADILDVGAMELKYDSQTKNYYVFQTVTLNPSEKKVLEITLKDVWQISPKELQTLKDHTAALSTNLEKSAYAEVASQLSGRINFKLAAIMAGQTDQTLSAPRKMSLYYENIKKLAGIKDDIGMLENLVIDTGGSVDERVLVPQTLLVSADGENTLSEGSIQLNVKISNPAKTSRQSVPVRYDLPREVLPKDILEANGLEVVYDFKKECFQLTREEISLGPGESKVFVIRIRDIWKISDQKLQSLRAHTENLSRILKNTVFAKQAESLTGKIFSNLDNITRAQSVKLSTNEHMAGYQDNADRLAQARETAAELEKLIVKSGAKPMVTVTRKGVVQGSSQDLKQNRGDDGVPFLSRSVFRGKVTFSVNAWKIIFSILFFVGIISAVFFGVWYKQIKDQGSGIKDQETGEK